MAMIHLEPQTAQMFSRALGALKPPPNLTLSQWADNYRRLSAEASAAQGRWNTDNAPFQREIMAGRTGTNADGVSVAGGGVRCVTLSIPQRYMHTPAEVCDLADIENTATLLAAYVKGGEWSC